MHGLLYDHGEVVDIDWSQYEWLVWVGQLNEDRFVMKTPDPPELAQTKK